MSKLLIPLAMILVLAAVVAVFRRPPLIRGMAGTTLVSPARPAVAVEPEPAFRLVDARRADLTLTDYSPTAPARVDVWYALWAADAVPARLTALLAVLEEPWYWITDVRSGFESLRERRIELGPFEGRAETFILPVSKDPWRASEEQTPWDRGSLVRRFTFRLRHTEAKLTVEYREPVPATRPGDDPAALSAFEDRAAAAFRLRDGSNAPLPRAEGSLPYPPENVSRRELAAYLGEVRRTDNR